MSGQNILLTKYLVELIKSITKSSNPVLGEEEINRIKAAAYPNSYSIYYIFVFIVSAISGFILFLISIFISLYIIENLSPEIAFGKSDIERSVSFIYLVLALVGNVLLSIAIVTFFGEKIIKYFFPRSNKFSDYIYKREMEAGWAPIKNTVVISFCFKFGITLFGISIIFLIISKLILSVA